MQWRNYTTSYDQLQQQERIAITAVVTGMAGVGKTELAIQYALHHKRESTYPGGICWIGVQGGIVGVQLLEFAKSQLGLFPPDDLSLRGQLDYCWSKWQPPGDVLLILDDVHQYEDIKDYLPPQEQRFKLRQFQSGDLINGEYQILGYLGKGGMGVTYVAQSLKTQSPVAVKAISLHEFQGKVKQWDGLNREVETLKNLNHRGIPAYLDYFELDYQNDYIYCLVQELAEGETLEKWIEKGARVTETDIRDIATQILNILDYLHNLTPAIIHRDIKPQNIIRSETGKLYLVDFGAVQHAYNQTLM